jgi:hypothetical protein
MTDDVPDNVTRLPVARERMELEAGPLDDIHHRLVYLEATVAHLQRALLRIDPTAGIVHDGGQD